MKLNKASVVLVATWLLESRVEGFAPTRIYGVASSSTKETFGVRSARTIPSKLYSTKDDQDEKGFMDVMQPWKVDIPEEVRDEIFKAEANTPAAKDRDARVTLYVILTIVGIALSSCNVFLSNIRADAGAAYNDLSSIEELGFGWVGGNPLTSFFLLNKIGGGIALLTAGFGGTMVELEQRTKNETAEKIWKELQRRNESASAAPKSSKKKAAATRKKKNKKQKNKKRLDAFAELIVEDETKQTARNTVSEPASAAAETSEIKSTPPVEVENKEEEGKTDGSLIGKMKEFYNKADQMAASQALLLNKELEDRGVVEKITDETGLKVIGKEAAVDLKKEKDKKK